MNFNQPAADGAITERRNTMSRPSYVKLCEEWIGDTEPPQQPGAETGTVLGTEINR